MAKINLLPWREYLHKERIREFASIAIGACILMGLVILYVHFHISGMIDAQNARNTRINTEMAKLDEKIAEIKTLKERRKRLEERIKVIQDLQGRRTENVHFFDELIRKIPDGLYLTRISQNASVVSLEGKAQSNARVSEFMKTLDESYLFENPRLEVIETVIENQVRSSRFKLSINQLPISGGSTQGGDAT